MQIRKGRGVVMSRRRAGFRFPSALTMWRMVPPPRPRMLAGREVCEVDLCVFVRERQNQGWGGRERERARALASAPARESKRERERACLTVNTFLPLFLSLSLPLPSLALARSGSLTHSQQIWTTPLGEDKRSRASRKPLHVTLLLILQVQA